MLSTKPATVWATPSFARRLWFAFAGSVVFAFLALFWATGHRFSVVFWLWGALPITLAAQGRQQRPHTR